MVPACVFYLLAQVHVFHWAEKKNETTVSIVDNYILISTCFKQLSSRHKQNFGYFSFY